MRPGGQIKSIQSPRTSFIVVACHELARLRARRSAMARLGARAVSPDSRAGCPPGKPGTAPACERCGCAAPPRQPPPLHLLQRRCPGCPGCLLGRLRPRRLPAPAVRLAAMWLQADVQQLALGALCLMPKGRWLAIQAAAPTWCRQAMADGALPRPPPLGQQAEQQEEQAGRPSLLHFHCCHQLRLPHPLCRVLRCLPCMLHQLLPRLPCLLCPLRC